MLPSPDEQPLHTERVILRTNDGYYVHTNPDDQGRVIATTQNRGEATVFVKEVFERYVALKDEARGMYVHAHAGGNSFLLANAQVRQANELYEEVDGEFGRALRTLSGWYWSAIGGGGSSVDAVVRHALSHESFHLESVGSSPSIPAPGDRPRGQMQIEAGGGYHIDGRPWLPCYWHDGSLFARYCNGGEQQAEAIRVLDAGAEANYDGERSWDTLDGGYWSGYHVGPRQTPDFWGKKQRWLELHKERGLKIFDSRGSMYPDSVRDPREFFHLLGQLYQAVGPEVIGVSEWCNESFGACPDDRRDPGLMRDCMSILKGYSPNTICAGSAYTGMPLPVDIINDWSYDIYLQHSFRGYHWPNKVEHAWSTPYEDQPSCRQGFNSEPPARNGRWVSAMQNDHECDADFQVTLALACWMTRQGFVLFSSPGVKPDPNVHITQIDGWREVPEARNWMPADVGRYTHIFHGGSGKQFSHYRVMDAGDGRAEHTYYQPDGRVVVLQYHQSNFDGHELRPIHNRQQWENGKCRLVVGQADKI
jgi:hypothetical protein